MLPSGSHLAFWDKGAPMYVNSARGGMEVQNHWGSVDAHAELPAERIAELFGTGAAYFTSAPAGGVGG